MRRFSSTACSRVGFRLPKRLQGATRNLAECSVGMSVGGGGGRQCRALVWRHSWFGAIF